MIILPHDIYVQNTLGNKTVNSMTDFSKKYLVTKASITKVAASLEERGVIDSCRDNMDARHFMFVATEKGRTLLNRVDERLYSESAKILDLSSAGLRKNTINSMIEVNKQYDLYCANAPRPYFGFMYYFSLYISKRRTNKGCNLLSGNLTI